MTRRTKDDWRKLIEKQSKSDLSVADFCKQHQLGQTYFYRQRSALKDQKTKRQPSSFIKVQAHKESAMHSASMTLQYHQSKLSLPISISPAWLAEFIKGLA